MEIFFNELSIDGQFEDLVKFSTAIDQIMRMRMVAREFGRELYCHRGLATAQVMKDKTMQQVVWGLGKDRCQALMIWMAKHGPFMDDVRDHSGDMYMTCNDAIVTDTSVGEAAYRCFYEQKAGLASVAPSAWEHSPMTVKWHEDADHYRGQVNVPNYLNAAALLSALEAAQAPLASWKGLEDVARRRCTRLFFSEACFKPLHGQPFVVGAASRILDRLTTLNQYRGCFDEQDNQTAQGHIMRQDYFTGENAPFSDSSDKEKAESKKKLEFPHPEQQGVSLPCPWHGKVNSTQPFRIHFSWPVRAQEPLYVVYVGPKITKR